MKVHHSKQSRLYNPISGILIINKPEGWTSFDVVAKIRNKLNVKKVGHTGTLDPRATGVLVLCIGKATKLVQKLTGMDKEYLCDITLGAKSATDDADGPFIPVEGTSPPALTEVEEVLDSFRGAFSQLPPDFSAKKIQGKRAYKTAREGKKPELKPVEVTVRTMELLDYKWPLIKLKIACSKGFYVRSLARDIGEKLDVGGYLSDLKRTKVGHFTIERAVSIEEADEKHLLPMEMAK